jgi:hypothetical protein
MSEPDVVTIPVVIAVILITICVVLLLSLAITCVFFDRDGYRRRLKRRALDASTSGARRIASARPTPPDRPALYGTGAEANGAACTAPARRPTNRREPWGRR